jgi:hypothetical protein
MLIDEAARHALHNRLDEVLGPDEAVCLMAHLPPVGWADVATKQDLQLLRQDFETVRQELQTDIALLRKDLDGLRKDLEGLEERLTHKLTAYFEKEIRRAITVQTLVQVGTILGVVALVKYG